MRLAAIDTGDLLFTDGRSIRLPLGSRVRQIGRYGPWVVERRSEANYQAAALHCGEMIGEVVNRLAIFFGGNG